MNNIPQGWQCPYNKKRIATVTQHGKDRLKERAGIKRSAADKNAYRALQNGVTHKETRGGLHRYISVSPANI